MTVKPLILLGVPKSMTTVTLGIVERALGFSRPEPKGWGSEYLAQSSPAVNVSHDDPLYVELFAKSFTEEQFAPYERSLSNIGQRSVIKEVARPRIVAEYMRRHPGSFNVMGILRAPGELARVLHRASSDLGSPGRYHQIVRGLSRFPDAKTDELVKLAGETISVEMFEHAVMAAQAIVMENADSTILHGEAIHSTEGIYGPLRDLGYEIVDPFDYTADADFKRTRTRVLAEAKSFGVRC